MGYGTKLVIQIQFATYHIMCIISDIHHFNIKTANV